MLTSVDTARVAISEVEILVVDTRRSPTTVVVEIWEVETSEEDMEVTEDGNKQETWSLCQPKMSILGVVVN